MTSKQKLTTTMEKMAKIALHASAPVKAKRPKPRQPKPKKKDPPSASTQRRARGGQQRGECSGSSRGPLVCPDPVSSYPQWCPSDVCFLQWSAVDVCPTRRSPGPVRAVRPTATAPAAVARTRAGPPPRRAKSVSPVSSTMEAAPGDGSGEESPLEITATPALATQPWSASPVFSEAEGGPAVCGGVSFRLCGCVRGSPRLACLDHTGERQPCPHRARPQAADRGWHSFLRNGPPSFL